MATELSLKRRTPVATSTDDINWQVVYREQLPRIYNFFRYRVADDALAEDLTSSTFEKAWRGRERYRHNLSEFSTWLFTIARNVATDHYRRNPSNSRVEQARGEASLEALQQTPDEKTQPDAIAMQQSDLAQLASLLATLPERERELLALKYGAELNNREIAKLTDLSESNVGTILHRTVTMLRTKWEE
jgi:RNA polymerase sigma-70 factor (ECF subfamily)